MNNLAIIVPFYKRPELTRLCFKRLKDQSKRLGVDVIVAGSEGDKSKMLARGLKYIETPNLLGTKLNCLLNECRGYDGVILLGSDDFISDSVISMYQEIRCDVQLFYSFKDVYVYSARIGKIVSDLDYTRAGNGIGVARMFTKPTLQAMQYEVWSNDRQRAMDGDCQTRLAAAGVREKQIPLTGHFIIDIKLESNLTSQEIVNTGHREHKLETLQDKLGKIGEDILKLKPTQPERIELNTETMKKVIAIVIKPYNGKKVGERVELKLHSYRSLKRAGYVTLPQEKKAPPAKVKAAPKKATKKAVAKKKK